MIRNYVEKTIVQKISMKKGNHMNAILRWIVFVMFLVLVTPLASFNVLADDDEHEKEHRYEEAFDRDDDDHHSGRKDSKHERERYLAPVENAAYKEACGACHFSYQPELLPSGSWGKILAGLEDHFGEAVELDIESKKIIAEHLKANGAEHSSAKRAVKIMRSLDNQTPLRITEIPYIREKHHEVSADVLKRKSIASLSNCPACHTTAGKGIYDDDNVIIPK
jgi:hypothetical protein